MAEETVGVVRGTWVYRRQHKRGCSRRKMGVRGGRRDSGCRRRNMGVTGDRTDVGVAKGKWVYGMAEQTVGCSSRDVGVRSGRKDCRCSRRRDVGVTAGVQSFWGIIQGISVWLGFICINFNFRLITWPRRGRWKFHTVFWKLDSLAVLDSSWCNYPGICVFISGEEEGMVCWLPSLLLYPACLLPLTLPTLPCFPFHFLIMSVISPAVPFPVFPNLSKYVLLFLTHSDGSVMKLWQ